MVTRRFRYAIHNLIGHPVSEVLWWLGLKRASRWVHGATLPCDADIDELVEEANQEKPEVPK